MSLQKISKDTFCRDYLAGQQAAAAKALLPGDCDRTISEWQLAWNKLLHSPTS